MRELSSLLLSLISAAYTENSWGFVAFDVLYATIQSSKLTNNKRHTTLFSSAKNTTVPAVHSLAVSYIRPAQQARLASRLA